ncbi:AEC family transporter [Noviherbaspirillum cavernae]|uniref:AEC family transporter n=1 Tax=Noviherbaspirillum cavernae TaxID=2320862 RepID=A0A418X3L2_9BURK|nr:AEC family transporter [Noviherbaspirillum cavernae]RJG07026.1 AEC family transporter [Noviherbaspirillum cavernae]
MHIAALLVPDFTLILIGFLLVRLTDWGTPFWAGLEKLVYYVLFPALLFHATARTSFDFATTGKMLEAALFATLCGIALGWFARPLFRAAPMVFESGVQTAFRFNSYIGLAIASRLAGEQGTTLMALIIGFAVPLCNMAAVHALAHKSNKLLPELARNPLLIAAAGGMLFNLLGLHLPDIAAATLARMGNASIAAGLIAVGAGLRLSGLHAAKGLACYFLAVKLLVLPLLGYGAARWLGLQGVQLQIIVMFCALPTASSAYVLAARMGGNGPFVAFLVSASTVVSAVTLPLWLGLAQ